MINESKFISLLEQILSEQKRVNENLVKLTNGQTLSNQRLEKLETGLTLSNQRFEKLVQMVTDIQTRVIKIETEHARTIWRG